MVNGGKVAIGAAALLALASLAKRGSRSLELAQKPTDHEISNVEHELRLRTFSSEMDARVHICSIINRNPWFLSGLYSRTGREPGSFRVEDLACQAYPLYKVSGGWRVGKKPGWLKVLTGKEYTNKVLEEIGSMQREFQSHGFSSSDWEVFEDDREDYYEDDELDIGDTKQEEISGFIFRLDIEHNIPPWVDDYLSENRKYSYGGRSRYPRDEPSIAGEVNNLIEREINRAVKKRVEETDMWELIQDCGITKDDDEHSDIVEIKEFVVRFRDPDYADLEPLKLLAKEASRGSVSGLKIDTLRKSAHELELGLSRARALLGVRTAIEELDTFEIKRRVEAQLNSSRWWVNHLDKLRIEVDEDDIEEDLRQEAGDEWVDDG